MTVYYLKQEGVVLLVTRFKAEFMWSEFRNPTVPTITTKEAIKKNPVRSFDLFVVIRPMFLILL